MADVKYRMQVEIAADSLLPRDVFMLNPCFVDHGVTSNPDQLCSDLATAIYTWMSPASSRQVEVTAYDLEGTPPVFPAGHALTGKDKAPASGTPRELAVCLSFYAAQNRPSHRGRLYVPFEVISGTAAGRPSSFATGKVAALVPLLSGLGGADVDWVVWSKKDRVARKVQNYWVDDEWDIQRSRGLRATLRNAGTTSG